jgi:hypothetical protein
MNVTHKNAIPVDLNIIVANNITLTAPSDPGCTWSAQVWMLENAFLAEHENPYQAVAMVARELKDKGLYKEPGEREDEIYATHLVVEELLEYEETERKEAD